MFKQSY